VHSRSVSISAIAVIGLVAIFFAVFWKADANAIDQPHHQEILIDCPAWEWQPSQIPNVEYEICFDDIDHCTTAEIGDTVCIPSMGVHDVWITAIDQQFGEPIYYDGDIVSIERVENADLSRNGVVGTEDLGLFIELFGDSSGSSADLDGDGVVRVQDFSLFRLAFGKCVSANEIIYVQC